MHELANYWEPLNPISQPIQQGAGILSGQRLKKYRHSQPIHLLAVRDWRFEASTASPRLP